MEMKPGKKLPFLLAGALLIIMVIVIAAVMFTPSVPDLPRITPDTTAPSPVIISHTFPFQDTNVTIVVPVNNSVYAGAKKSERRVIHIRNSSDIEGELYRAMIHDPLQEPLYTDLLSQFRTVRDTKNLNDDEYLELLAVYVQSLTYTISDDPAKYPIETVMEKAGDCDDKSLLLAGLLAREDYPVVLLLFRPEKHMAVGVGSDSFPYKSTGYAYVEATDFSFVGIPAYTLRGNNTLTSDPVVIPVSSGKKQYHSGSETEYIDTMSALAGRRAAELSKSLRAVPDSTAENRSVYLEEFRDLDHYATVHNYVLAHKFDRPGVYAYLQREMA